VYGCSEGLARKGGPQTLHVLHIIVGRAFQAVRGQWLFLDGLCSKRQQDKQHSYIVTASHTHQHQDCSFLCKSLDCPEPCVAEAGVRCCCHHQAAVAAGQEECV
jgi:hypothetical protein